MAAQAEHASPVGPFSRPVADTIWLGPTQQAGLVHLCATTPVKALLGPAESGKTTLLQHIHRHIDEALILPVAGPQADAGQVLSALLTAAGLEHDGLAEVDLRNLLRVFIEHRSFEGTRVILGIDNVSGFAAAAWAEIVALLGIKIGRKPIVEIAVVGTEPEAAEAPLAQLSQEGTTAAVEAFRYLSAPTDEDIERYIGWRLTQTGLRNNFSPGAIHEINSISSGRFNTINGLCESILRAHGQDTCTTIDARVVSRVAESLTETHQSSEPDSGIGDRELRQLVVSRDGRIETILRLGERIVIGRGPTSDVVLESQYLSRHHAMILPAPDGRYAVIDLNSVNGVFVNGGRVSRQFLGEGDIVNICQYQLELTAD